MLPVHLSPAPDFLSQRHTLHFCNIRQRQRIQSQCQTVFYNLECRASHSIQFRSNRGTAGGEHQLQRLPVVTVIAELPSFVFPAFL